jgi:hypothetical protein
MKPSFSHNIAPVLPHPPVNRKAEQGDMNETANQNDETLSNAIL